MDISKLPKLSQTRPGDAPQPVSTDDVAKTAGAPPAPPPCPEQPNNRDYERPGPYAEPGGPEAWISFAMAGLIVLLNPRLLQYLLSPGTFSTKYTFSDEHGAPLPYPSSVFFWNDVALTGFALVMLLDAIVLLVANRRPAVVFAAFVITVLATLANLLYLVMTLNTYGIAIFSAIAVAYGGYIAIHQWRLFTISLMRAKSTPT